MSSYIMISQANRCSLAHNFPASKVCILVLLASIHGIQLKRSTLLPGCLSKRPREESEDDVAYRNPEWPKTMYDSAEQSLRSLEVYPCMKI